MSTAPFNINEFVSTKSEGEFVVSLNRGKLNQVAAGWETATFDSFAEWNNPALHEILDSLNWLSPCVWHGGARNKESFVYGNTYWLDFDDGHMTVEDAIQTFAKLDAFLYTTKSHQINKGDKPAYDRFRVGFGLSRTIVNPTEWYTLGKFFVEKFGHDKQACDTARGFVWHELTMPSYIGGSGVIDVDKVLAYCHAHKISTPTYTSKIQLSSKRIKGLPQTVGRCDGYLLREFNKRLKKPPSDWNERETCAKVFTLLVWAWGIKPHYESILGTVGTIDWVADWFDRHPHQRASFGQQVLRAFDVFAKSRIKKDGYKLLEYVNRLKRIPSGDIYKLIASAVKKRKRVIIDAACGRGKSTQMEKYVADCTAPEKRFVIVKQTRHDCEATILRLSVATAGKGIRISYYAGFSGANCKAGYKNNEYIKMYSRKSPCILCPHQSACDFGQSFLNPQTVLDADIVVMTHAKFLGLNESSSTVQLDPKAVIFIDESLRLFETYTLTQNRRAHIVKKMPTDIGIKLTRFFKAVDRVLADGSAQLIIHSEIFQTAELKDALKSLITDETIDDELWEFISFFKSQHRRWAMKDGTDIAWIRDRFELSLPNTAVILDASARLTPICFHGFEVWRPEERTPRRYPNVKICALPRNPTQMNLKKEWKNFESAVEHLLALHPNTKVFLATNAPQTLGKLEAVRKFVDKISKRQNVVHKTSGTIAGSNDARDAEFCVLAMSLFTRVSDYVLRACVATNALKIDADRIWRNKKHPNMKRNGGFSDPAIDLQFRRQYIDALYQSLMRGVVRCNNNAPYTVCCYVAGVWMLRELENLIPGFQLEIIDGFADDPVAEQMIGYQAIKAGGMDHITSYDELCRLFGYDRKDAEAVKDILANLA